MRIRDSSLAAVLGLIDAQIERLFAIEHEFLELDGSKKALLAALTINSEGKSFSEREARALASDEWQNFAKVHAQKEAEFNREKRRHELLLKKFDATYIEYKIEESAIRRQV